MNEQLKIIISAETSKLKAAVKEAKTEVDSLASKGKAAFEKFSSAAKTAGKAVATGLKAVGTAVAAAGTALLGLSESTREYRDDMAKLQAGFSQAGLSAQSATGTFKTLYGVIGETDQAVEASQQIALLAQSEEDAAKWAGYAAGIMGTFSDALQPETFYEAANETLALGEATGAFVQVLEGAHLSVEDFNAELAACKTESEKLAVMEKWVEEAVGDAGDAYNNATDQIQKNRIASISLTAALAEMGAAVEPIATEFKMGLALALEQLIPSFSAVSEAALGMIQGVEGSSAQFRDAFATLVSDTITVITDLLPTLTTVGIELVFGLVNGLISGLPQLIDAAGQLITQLITGITTNIPILLATVKEIVPQIASSLVSNITMIIDAAVQLFLALVDAIPQVIPLIVAAIPQLITGIVNALVSNLPAIINGGIQLLLGLIQAIPVVIQALIPMIPTIVQAIVQVLLANIPVLVMGAVQLLMGIIQAIPQIIAALGGAIPQIISAIVKGLVGGAGQIAEGALQMFKGIGEKAGEAKDKALNKFEELKTKAKDKFSSMKNNVDTQWNGIRDSIGNKSNESNNKVSSAFSNIQSTMTSKLGAAKSSVSGLMTNISDLFSGKMETAKSKVSAAMDKIKGSTKFSWNLPKLKMPKITVSGKFGLNPPSVPKFRISWNKLGGVFDNPALFTYGNSLQGLGEDGAEAVVPLEKNTKWLDKIADKIAAKQGNMPIVLQVDGKTFAQVSIDSINALTRQRGNLGLNII